LIGQLEALFESLIDLINTAIDDKSPYTGGHCNRVPTLTMMLAEAAAKTNEGPLKEFSMSDKDRYELKIAGLLHDCGKITTPVHVVDKATKLETIFDRIHLIDTRFELLMRQRETAMLRSKVEALSQGAPLSTLTHLDEEFSAWRESCLDDREFLRRQNIGGEKMRPDDQERVRRIGAVQVLHVDGSITPFLSEEELRNLTIPYGTLTPEERAIINHHIVATIKMLEALPWPKHLKRVPEYAGGHHERMDGKGYPKGLKREQMSLQARIMGIADIFEALTAKDRPYKKGKTLSESISILKNFRDNGHIDPDLFEVFLKEKVYLEYAKRFLDPEQIDEVPDYLGQVIPASR
jgi:HD domain